MFKDWKMALAAVVLINPPAPGNAQTYPDFESQWRSAGVGDAWDPAKPAGLAQQAPLTPEYQAIFEASLRDQAAGGRGSNYRVFESTGLPLHSDNQTIVKERIYLDKNDKDILHDAVTTIDHALTRPWTVDRIYLCEQCHGQ
jgi:hypothetical protein